MIEPLGEMWKGVRMTQISGLRNRIDNKIGNKVCEGET